MKLICINVIFSGYANLPRLKLKTLKDTGFRIMNIAGVLIHAAPGRRNVVEQGLRAVSGVEIHAVTEEGRFVVTLDDNDAKRIADTMSQLHTLDGVLTAAMVYQYSENEVEADETEQA